MGSCLSSRRWWTFSAPAVKLFCKFFLKTNKRKLVCLLIWMSPKLTYSRPTAVAKFEFHAKHMHHVATKRTQQ